MSVRILQGDALELLPTLSGLDACVCDPPYHLTSGNAAVDWSAFGPNGSKRPNIGPTNKGGRGHKTGFMGKSWDGGATAFQPETWRLVLNAMKPGAYIIAFASTRGYHRMACAIEDAGFITHPMIGWIFGSGFPKATRIKAPGTEHLRYGLQALKPALEPIYMGQKPMEGTGTENWLKHGTGAINVDGCRVATDEPVSNHSRGAESAVSKGIYGDSCAQPTHQTAGQSIGRWPANLCHDGSDEVLDAFAAYGERPVSGSAKNGKPALGVGSGNGVTYRPVKPQGTLHSDSGSAARFFYCGKADADDRAGSSHPTVKPLALMRWLVRLVTPPGGTVLDCFAGSGTTGEAARLEGFNAVLIEREAEYVADIRRRMGRASGDDAPLFAGVA